MCKDLQNMAKLAIHLGCGGQPGVKGKPILVEAPPESFLLVRAIIKEAYRIGASQGIWSPMTPELTAQHILAHPDDPKARNEVPPHFAADYNLVVEQGGCAVRIQPSGDPLAFASVNPDHAKERAKAEYPYRKRFIEAIRGGAIPWTIVPHATTGWGKLVCPDASDPRAALQDLINQILEVDKDDCVGRWMHRAARLERRSEQLNALGVDSLHFLGEGTDLQVGLSHLARFSGAYKTTRYGVRHAPNIPCCEVFTVPDYRRTRGWVRITRPVIIAGTVVRGLEVRFGNSGEVISFSADEGAAAFTDLLNSPGANRLGEVALVGIDDSPISDTGEVYQEVVIDENAACHVAFGRGLRDQLKGGAKMTEAQLKAVGCNLSQKHHDLMISDAGTKVVATLRSGARVVLIENGVWAGDLSRAAA